jgi:hypothetical protein
MRTTFLALTVCTLALTAAPAPTSAQGQTSTSPRRMGPVVPSFGGAFEVPNPGLLPPKDQDLSFALT